MTSDNQDSGRVQYTRRAFHQDASEAMRGDIVRGLIEMITNSDDAYARLEEELAGPGKIRVEVEHRRTQPWTVRVRDRATGIDNLRHKIIELGGRTSGFERGEDQRGNFGRGAKDLAAFGNVNFSTIYEGRFQSLLLRPDGTWELLENRKTTADDRAAMGIPRGNGTVVEIRVRENIRCSRHDTLRRRLSTHFALRDIMKDPNRKVDLVNLNDGSTDLLVYQDPPGHEVLDEELEIEDYPDARAHLSIRRLEVKGTEGPEDAGRAHGTLIKGQRGIYENTLFKFEGNVHAGWFAGEVRCLFIDKLAREYDDRFEAGREPSADNPVPILSRRRDTLNRNHPFYEVLRSAVEQPLGELVTAEAERARREAGNIENSSTRAALDRLAREAGRLINEELRDIEADVIPDIAGEGRPPLLQVIPEQGYAYMGEDRTLTCAARLEGLDVGAIVDVEVDPGGVVELLTQEVELREHRRREDVLVGQIRVRPLIEGESTLVSARLDNREAHALIEVRPEREIVEEEIVPPETLEFSRPSHRVGWQREKEVTLQAPAWTVADHGTSVQISSSDPGIVTRTPSVELAYDEDVEFYKTSVRMQARRLGATAEIRARMGELVATAHIAVTRKEESPGIRFKLVNEDFGHWRAVADTETGEGGEEIKVIKIAGRHPGLQPYLGHEGENQESRLCRSVIAEIAADVSARLVVEELFRMRRSLEDFDSARFYREHYRRITKFLPRFQRLLVGPPAAVQSPKVDELVETA